VNPNIYGDRLSLNVSLNDGLLDFELALEVAKYFELSLDEAKNETKRIKDTVNKNWQLLAKEYGLSKSDVERMEAAFALCMD